MGIHRKLMMLAKAKVDVTHSDKGSSIFQYKINGNWVDKLNIDITRV